MSQPARWLPDPYGRFQQRYFDGSNWTAHVFNDGDQGVDPLGTTVAVPFAIPTSSTIAGSAPVQLHEFLDGLGPDARARPSVRLSIALAGVGGAAAAIGIAAAIVGDGGDSRARIGIAAVVIVVIAYAIRLGVKSQPEVRSAAVGAAVIGIPGLATATTSTNVGGGTLVLAAVLLVAAWSLPGMLGRPLMLGAGAVGLVIALTTIGDDTASSTDVFDFGVADVIGGKTWVFVIAAIALLAMVWWLDAHGYHGVGTSLVVAAILATAFAVVKVVEDLGSTGSALLLAIAGLAIAAVGNNGQRRASTWFGVAVVAIGTVAVFASAIEPNSAADLATTLIISGVALIVAPGLLKAIRASRSPQPDEEPQPPPSDGSGVRL
jgi:uncharacterized protein DUF2510